MKLSITLNRIFGANNVDDWNDVNDDDDVVEYFAIYHNVDTDNNCEPDYFLRYYQDGTYQLNDLGGTVLHKGNDLSVLKKVLKKLPKAS